MEYKMKKYPSTPLRMTSYSIDNEFIKVQQRCYNTNVTLSGVEVFLIQFPPVITALCSNFFECKLRMTVSLSHVLAGKTTFLN
jgi:hypothetical protein